MTQQVDTQDQLMTVGERVADRYDIRRHLGTGGFAKVFCAFDSVIEREVAIKFLDLRGVGGSSAMVATVLERFRREAKLAAKIPHRNVVNIYDIGQLDQGGYRPFIVMELLHGHDLEDQLNDHGPIEPERLLPLYVDCLDALGEAHDLGIVHKDLKPSNLFLSNPGVRSESLRIVDFGIAHIKGTAAEEHEEPGQGGRLTATGQILGTLQYLTPEYIAAQTISSALDVYQMALILVEMLSGERVIKTDNAFECLRIHTFGLLELPEYLLQSPLGEVLRKALEPDHQARYATAKVFADALSQIDPLSVPPSPLTRGEPSVRTRTLGDPLSSPSLIRPKTGDLRRPTTDERGASFFPTEGLDAGLAPGAEREEAPVDVTLAEHEPMRARANKEIDTSLTPLAKELNEDLGFPVAAASRQSRKKLFVALGAVALLIVFAGGALVALLTERPVPTPPPVVSDEPIAPVAPTLTPPAGEPELDTLQRVSEDQPLLAAPVEAPIAQEEEDSEPPPPPPPAKSAPRELRVRFDVTPRRAQVAVKGGSFKRGTIRIPSGRDSVEVLVTAPGYHDEELVIGRDSNKRSVKLVKKAVSSARKAPSQTESPPPAANTPPVEAKPPAETPRAPSLMK